MEKILKGDQYRRYACCIALCVRGPESLQILGNLYPQMEGRKGQTALDHFKQAAEKNTSNGEVLEMLAELLATTDPAGMPSCSASSDNSLHPLHVCD